MSLQNALTELHNRLQQTVGLKLSPDVDDTQALIDAESGNFEGSYMVLLDIGAQPFPSFSLAITELSLDIQIEIGAEINNSREAAQVRLNDHMLNLWRDVFSDLSWASHIKSLINLEEPELLTSPQQPNRLVLAFVWQLIYLEQ